MPLATSLLDFPATSHGGVERILEDDQFAARNSFQELAELLELPIALVRIKNGSIVSLSNPEMLPYIPEGILSRTQEEQDVIVQPVGDDLVTFSIPLNGEFAAVGYSLVLPESQPRQLTETAMMHGWSLTRWRAWLRQIPQTSVTILSPHLKNTLRCLHQDQYHRSLRKEVDQLTNQLDSSWEEVNLLHSLMHNLRIARAPEEFGELCLERLREVVRSEGEFLWLTNETHQSNYFVRGQVPFDEFGLARLTARFENCDFKRPLIKNRIVGTPLEADFPGLRNLILISTTEGQNRSGWIGCVNLPEREFGQSEARLLGSVASIIGVHLRNVELFKEREDLLLDFVRSLVSSLDAKDRYTRGHSERVALIARRIAQEMGLGEDELENIYLSGLLHDIGKIGVDDSILRKVGPLTPEEFENVKRHPVIGYNILVGIKTLHRVLPGVRHHHEQFNGAGYPDGLIGEQIPLMARIMAVADSFDAMASDRPYRPGRPIGEIDEIFRKGANQQWDGAVISAYFRVHNEVRLLCERHDIAETVNRSVVSRAKNG